jgi:lipopolysaccharide heptosyltransferase II
MTARPSLVAGDRVLITRLNYLGDVVLSLPLVDAIARAVPGVEIDYLTRGAAAALLAPDTRFARVHTLENGALASAGLVRRLRARRYRAVIDLYSNPRSAWLSFFSGSPIRIGGDRRGRRHLYTHPIHVPPSVRAVTEIFMQYAAPLGISGAPGKPTLALGPAEIGAADATLAGVSRDGPLIGVHPGGKWSVKRWPTGRFVELIERLRAGGATVVVFTGPDEPEATGRVREQVGDGAAFLPAMPVREVAAVMSRLDAMVACDGGVMHVSVAVGTPTVGIFGSSEAGVWFPYEHAGPFRAAAIDVPCRPCHKHECPLGHTRCLNDLGASYVARLVGDVLARSGAEVPR